MTASAESMPRRRRLVPQGVRDFWAGITAVGTKELRGRMRGRRAFVVLSIYLLLLSGFAFGIYLYLREQASAVTFSRPDIGFPVESGFGGGIPTGGGGTALSANIGHAIFSGLLMVETILVLVLAPAFTAGAISLEREKQTLDLLVTTPLSTLGMVLGKLISALGYVFILILASIPLASVVFAFGGVGPEDLIRGYLLLFAVAFGMGAIGLFISALVRRTQTATVITFVIVLAMTLGTAALHQFLVVVSQPDDSNGFITVQGRHKAPEALLWLNPLVADLDLVCTTVPSGYHQSCEYLATVTGKPYFGSSLSTGTEGCPPNARCVDPGLIEGGLDDAVNTGLGGADAGGGIKVLPNDVDFAEAAATDALTLGFPRDTFWPRSSLAFVLVGGVLLLLSTQLIAPSRRLRLPRLRRRRAAPTSPATESADIEPITDRPAQTLTEVEA